MFMLQSGNAYLYLDASIGKGGEFNLNVSMETIVANQPSMETTLQTTTTVSFTEKIYHFLLTEKRIWVKSRDSLQQIRV